MHYYETLRITVICEESILPWEVCKYAYLIIKLLDVNFDLIEDATVIGKSPLIQALPRSILQTKATAACSVCSFETRLSAKCKLCTT